MKFKIRTTHAFAEIRVDEVETTVYKSYPKEIEDMISNLLSVANDLTYYTGKPLSEYMDKEGF